MEAIHLKTVLQSLPELKLGENANGFVSSTVLAGITHDSRKARQNYIFVAAPDLSQVDPYSEKCMAKLGAYIEAAIVKGAVAIVLDETVLLKLKSKSKLLPGILYLVTPNCHKTLSDLSRIFYPSCPKNLIAVTGTNGKTSTTSFVRQILAHLGHRVASLGTMGLQVDNVPHFEPDAVQGQVAGYTSPVAPVFHQCLHSLAEEYAVEYLVFEASSHGLKEYRAHGVGVKIAVFTNFTQEHLDYHPSMEDYFESKCKLFSDLLVEGGVAFLSNRMTPVNTQALRNICAKKQASVWIYGQDHGDSYFKMDKPSIAFNLWGNELVLPTSCLHKFPTFQFENLLVACAAVSTLLQLQGEKLREMVAQVPQFIQCVPGRMEYIGSSSSGGKVFVDYAHTHDALEIILRGFAKNSGNLVVVFGCGGNRDTGKRYKMGRIAAMYATHVIVTDDNPRHEDPAHIRKEILGGVLDYLSETGKVVQVHEVGERRGAIRIGIGCLQSESDVCIVAGKGAEPHQIIGNVYHKLSDKETILEILKEM